MTSSAHLLLGQQALDAADAETALEHCGQAMLPPQNLGEAYHLLQAKADVSYWTGKALRALGSEDEAMKCFEQSANEEATAAYLIQDGDKATYWSADFTDGEAW